MTLTRAPLLLGTLLAVIGLTAAGHAQQAKFVPQEVGQLIEAALNNVLPSEKLLTNASVAQRGIRFDFRKTADAFGVAIGAAPSADLGVRRELGVGSQEMLADCDQAGMKPCARLGSASYVYLEPVSRSETAAVVWLHVTWATTLPSKRSYRSGFSTQVHFSRASTGVWTFVRTGKTVTG